MARAATSDSPRSTSRYKALLQHARQAAVFWSSNPTWLDYLQLMVISLWVVANTLLVFQLSPRGSFGDVSYHVIASASIWFFVLDAVAIFISGIYTHSLREQRLRAARSANATTPNLGTRRQRLAKYMTASRVVSKPAVRFIFDLCFVFLTFLRPLRALRPLLLIFKGSQVTESEIVANYGGVSAETVEEPKYAEGTDSVIIAMFPRLAFIVVLIEISIATEIWAREHGIVPPPGTIKVSSFSDSLWYCITNTFFVGSQYSVFNGWSRVLTIMLVLLGLIFTGALYSVMAATLIRNRRGLA